MFKSITFGDLLRRFVDVDRIHENKVRREKFVELVAETHNAHDSLKIYSGSSLLTLSTSFFFLAVSSGTNLASYVPICVMLYNT